jgi:hypothetical protein
VLFVVRSLGSPSGRGSGLTGKGSGKLNPVEQPFFSFSFFLFLFLWFMHSFNLHRLVMCTFMFRLYCKRSGSFMSATVTPIA